MTNPTWCLFLAIATGCASTIPEEDGRDDSFLDAKADTYGLVDGSPEARGVLEVASTASFDILADDAGLSSTTARSIVDARDLDPGHRFDKLAELDAVPFVGPIAFERLLTFAREHGYVEGGGGGDDDVPPSAFAGPLLLEGMCSTHVVVEPYNQACEDDRIGEWTYGNMDARVELSFSRPSAGIDMHISEDSLWIAEPDEAFGYYTTVRNTFEAAWTAALTSDRDVHLHLVGVPNHVEFSFYGGVNRWVNTSLDVELTATGATFSAHHDSVWTSACQEIRDDNCVFVLDWP